MTWSIYVGEKQVQDVSNSTRDIFTVVARELEHSKSGSRFPLFHHLQGEDSEPIHWKKTEVLLDEIKEISLGLSPILYPIASYRMQGLEVGYSSQRGQGGGISFRHSKSGEVSYGIDSKGLFVDEGLNKRIYFQRLKRKHPYFSEFLFPTSSPFIAFPQEKIDEIVYDKKSARLIFGRTLESLTDFAIRARTKKKHMRGD